MTTDSTPPNLHDRMQWLSASHELPELGVDEVIARGAARSRRRRMATVAAVLVLVMGVAAVVATVAGNDDNDTTDVASGDDLESADDATASDVEPEPADVERVEEFATTTTMAADSTMARDVAVSSYYGGGLEWVVPWGDGFLSSGRVLDPSDATMADLVPDIADRLPPEVIEALGDVTDVNEASALLDDVGLLDEATAAVMEDPVLYNAYNQVMAGGTWRTEVSRSSDGETWTVLDDFALPGGAESVSMARSDGERLVLVEQRQSDSEVIVHSTTDLVTWTSTTVSIPDAGFPDFVYSENWVGGFVFVPGGWHLTVTTNGWIDVWQLMPEAVRAEAEGWGWSIGPEGVRLGSNTLDFVDDGFSEDTADDRGGLATTTTMPNGDSDGEGRLVPWSELGITYEDYERYTFNESVKTTGFLGTWGGEVNETAMPQSAGCCGVVSTDGGLIAHAWTQWTEDGEVPGRLYFSADGTAWSEIDGPPGANVSSLAAVDGGVLAVDQNGTLWRAGVDGSGWTEVEIPGLPEQVRLWFDGLSHRGAAAVVDFGTAETFEQVPYVVTFEHDGFGFNTDYAADGAAEVTITDLATDDVVLDRSFVGAIPDFVQFDDLGNIELLDDDGEVIVVVPLDVYERETSAALQAAQSAAGWTEPDYSYVPDYWVVATIDGIEWHVEELTHADDYGFGLPAINGNRVVVREWNGGWKTLTID